MLPVQNELQTAFQAASAEMYAQTGNAQAGPNAGQANNNASQNSNKNDNVQDADFEEVK